MATEVLSSDFFRGLVSDDANDQSATKDAFDSLYFIARRRLARGKLTAIDATNVQPQDRQGYVQLAAQFHLPVIAIVLNLTESVCFARNDSRLDRKLSAQVLYQQLENLRLGLAGLPHEGFHSVHIISTVEELASLEFSRV